MFKWVGSKRRLLEDVLAYLPGKVDNYYEPFFGAGHIGLTMLERGMINKTANFSDSNPDLMAFWMALKNSPDDLWNALKELRHHQSKDDFLRIRDINKDDVCAMGARFYYLVTLGYRGLWRVNSEGRFNVSYGGEFKKEEFMPNEEEFKKVHKLLDSKKVVLRCSDFATALNTTGVDMYKTAIYLDPPYFNTFDAYQLDGFGKHEHVVLFSICERLKKKGARIVESNSDSPFIRDLYRKYDIHEVRVVHNANVLGPQAVKELVIT